MMDGTRRWDAGGIGGGGVVSFNVHANQLTWVGWMVRVGGTRGGRGGVVSFDVHANQLTWVGRGGGGVVSFDVPHAGGWVGGLSWGRGAGGGGRVGGKLRCHEPIHVAGFVSFGGTRGGGWGPGGFGKLEHGETLMQRELTEETRPEVSPRV